MYKNLKTTKDIICRKNRRESNEERNCKGAEKILQSISAQKI